MIAEKNRQQDLHIAKQYYEQDVRLANDQQEQLVLAEYLTTLTELLETYGVRLTKNEVGRFIARYNTLAALEQRTSPKRKSILIRSLLATNLLRIEGDGVYRNPSISLRTADLTGLVIREDIYLYIADRSVPCLDLGFTKLMNSSFRRTIISGTMFDNSLMTHSDLSFTIADLQVCSTEQTYGVIFLLATLDDSNFTYATYTKAYFIQTSLIRAQMRNFSCFGCIAAHATFKPSKDYFCMFETLSEQLSDFSLATMAFACLYHAKFECGQFGLAKMIHANATRASFIHCKFEQADLVNISLVESTIINSIFIDTALAYSTWIRAKVINTSFIGAQMRYVRFTHGECHHCLFAKTDLTGADFTNTSLTWSNFTGATVTFDQLALARLIKGVVLPNGTLIECSEDHHELYQRLSNAQA